MSRIWFAQLAASGELPDVFILNAGINRLDNDEAFDLPLYREVIETNLYGVLNFVAPLTRVAGAGVERHIVAISSMVNYGGNPYALGYQTSKKALTACFDVWAGMYAETDLVFKQVMLGPVQTAIYTMGDRLPGWMAGMKSLSSASLDDTVRAISRFAPTRSRKLIYPWRALPAFGAMWLGRRLVPGFFQGRQDAGRKPAAAPADRGPRRVGHRETGPRRERKLPGGLAGSAVFMTTTGPLRQARQDPLLVPPWKEPLR